MSLATCTIIEAIVFNTRRTMPVSVLISDYHGVSDLCLSVPAVIGAAGVLRVLQPDLNESKVAAFKKSAEVIRREIDSAMQL